MHHARGPFGGGRAPHTPPRPGTIRGMVVDVRIDQEMPRQGCQGGGFFGQQRSIPILRFRLKAEDGTMFQVQFKGDRRGDVALNDVVQVRGRNAGGVVLATWVYNENTSAVIAQSGGCVFALLCMLIPF